MRERKLRGLCEKASRLDAESAREGDDIEQSDVSLAAFDVSDIVAMKAGYLGKFFLGEIPLKTQFAQLLAKNGPGIRRGHAMSLRRMTTMSLHTMSVYT